MCEYAQGLRWDSIIYFPSLERGFETESGKESARGSGDDNICGFNDADDEHELSDEELG
jgi:hypothetical protein